MSAVEVAEKRCTACGETKPLSEFHRSSSARDGRHCWCKPCVIAKVAERNKKRRAEMGDEAFKALRREQVARSRARRGNDTERIRSRAVRIATQQLIDAHRDTYERLLAAALYDLGYCVEERRGRAVT